MSKTRKYRFKQLVRLNSSKSIADPVLHFSEVRDIVVKWCVSGILSMLSNVVQFLNPYKVQSPIMDTIQWSICWIKSKITNNSRQKTFLLDWVKTKTNGSQCPANFDKDWANGIVLCGLVESVEPGSCPRYDLLNPDHGMSNVNLALDLIQKHFGINEDLEAEEIIGGKAETKLIYLLSRLKLLSAKLKLKAALKRPVIMITNSDGETAPTFDGTPMSDEQDCFAKGMGLILAVKGRKARFNIFFKSSTRLNIVIEIIGRNSMCSERITTRSPKNRGTSAEMIASAFISKASFKAARIDDGKEMKIPFTYEVLPNKISVTYIPVSTGKHRLSIIWQGQHIMGSPYTITVDDTIDLNDNSGATTVATRPEQRPHDRTRYPNGTVIRRRIIKQVMIVNGQERPLDRITMRTLATVNDSLADHELDSNDVNSDRTDSPPSFQESETTNSPLSSLLQRQSSFQRQYSLCSDSDLDVNQILDTDIVDVDPLVAEIMVKSKRLNLRSQAASLEGIEENVEEDADAIAVNRTSDDDVEMTLPCENTNENLVIENVDDIFDQTLVQQMEEQYDNYCDLSSLNVEDLRSHDETYEQLRGEDEKSCDTLDGLLKLNDFVEPDTNFDDLAAKAFADLAAPGSWSKTAIESVIQDENCLINGSFLPVRNMVKQWEGSHDYLADDDSCSDEVGESVDAIRGRREKLYTSVRSRRKVFETLEELEAPKKVANKVARKKLDLGFSVKDTRKFWETISSQSTESDKVRRMNSKNVRRRYSPVKLSPLRHDIKQLNIERIVVIDEVAQDGSQVESHSDSGIDKESVTELRINYNKANGGLNQDENHGDEAKSQAKAKSPLNFLQQKSHTYPVIEVTGHRGHRSSSSSSRSPSKNSNECHTSSVLGFIDDEIPDSAPLVTGDYASFTGLLGDDRVTDFSPGKDRQLLTEVLRGQSDDEDHESPKPENCIVYGSGVYYGQVGMRNQFTVETRDAGNGYLTVGIEGAKQGDVVEVSIVYAGDNVYNVFYQVNQPGYYVIYVRWGERNIVESPFVCKVTY